MTLTYTAPTHKFPCLHPASNHISLPLSVSPPCILHYRLLCFLRKETLSPSLSLSLTHTHTTSHGNLFIDYWEARPQWLWIRFHCWTSYRRSWCQQPHCDRHWSALPSFSMGFVFFSQSARSLGLFGQCCACNYMISELGFSSYLFFMAQHSLSFCVVLVSFPPFPVSWFLFLILCRVSWAVSVQWQCDATKEGDHNFLWNTVEAVKTKAPSFLLLPSFSSSLF